MYRETFFVTSDGKHYASEKDAKRHAEALYGNELGRLVRGLLPLTYTAMQEFVDANLDAFVRLSALKADIELTEKE